MAKAGMRRPNPYDADNHGTENHHKMNRPENKKFRALLKTAMQKPALSMHLTGPEMIIRLEIMNN